MLHKKNYIVKQWMTLSIARMFYTLEVKRNHYTKSKRSMIGLKNNQPLMKKFGLPGTTRASFYFYNTMEEIDRMIEILHDAVRFFA